MIPCVHGNNIFKGVFCETKWKQKISSEHLPSVSASSFSAYFAVVTSGHIRESSLKLGSQWRDGGSCLPSHISCEWQHPGLPYQGPTTSTRGGRWSERKKVDGTDLFSLQPNIPLALKWSLCWGFWGHQWLKEKKHYEGNIDDSWACAQTHLGVWYFCFRSGIKAKVKLVRDTPLHI